MPASRSPTAGRRCRRDAFGERIVARPATKSARHSPAARFGGKRRQLSSAATSFLSRLASSGSSGGRGAPQSRPMTRTAALSAATPPGLSAWRSAAISSCGGARLEQLLRRGTDRTAGARASARQRRAAKTSRSRRWRRPRPSVRCPPAARNPAARLRRVGHQLDHELPVEALNPPRRRNSGSGRSA